MQIKHILPDLSNILKSIRKKGVLEQKKKRELSRVANHHNDLMCQ